MVIPGKNTLSRLTSTLPRIRRRRRDRPLPTIRRKARTMEAAIIVMPMPAPREARAIPALRPTILTTDPDRRRPIPAAEADRQQVPTPLRAPVLHPRVRTRLHPARTRLSDQATVRRPA